MSMAIPYLAISPNLPLLDFDEARVQYHTENILRQHPPPAPTEQCSRRGRPIRTSPKAEMSFQSKWIIHPEYRADHPAATEDLLVMHNVLHSSLRGAQRRGKPWAFWIATSLRASQ
jgi:hypothetical protein